MSDPQSITLLLRQLDEHRRVRQSVDEESVDLQSRLYERVQSHFRSVAEKLLAGYPRHAVPPTTELVDDAFFKLLQWKKSPEYVDRHHFLAIAAKTMRRLMVSHFRALNADKRRVLQEAVPLSGEVLADLRVGLPCQIIELDDIITSLESKYPKAMQALVYSRYLRMTYEEIADAMKLSEYEVESLIRIGKIKIKRAFGQE